MISIAQAETPSDDTFSWDSGVGSWNKKFSGFTSRCANLQGSWNDVQAEC